MKTIQEITQKYEVIYCDICNKQTYSLTQCQICGNDICFSCVDNKATSKMTTLEPYYVCVNCGKSPYVNLIDELNNEYEREYNDIIRDWKDEET